MAAFLKFREYKMARKLVVNRLEADELTYELTYRGVKTGSVDEMRRLLTMTRRLEKSGDSIRYPVYPYTFDEDKTALEGKCGDVEDLLNNFSGGPNGGSAQKLQTKLSHMLNRLDNMTPADDDQAAVKSTLLAKVLELHDALEKKIDVASNILPPVALAVATAGSQSFQAGIVNAQSSSPIRQSGSSPRIHRKVVLPHEWGIEKFSGTNKSFSVTAFFEKIEELRIARNVSTDILVDSGVDLFTEKAYQFYKDVRLRVTTWAELVEEFRREYLGAYHNDVLFDELRKRFQHPSESIGVYLAVMSSYFKRMTCPMTEEVQLAIILKNLHPFYQERLRDPYPTTLDELRQICRRMEDRRDAIQHYVEPTGKRMGILERDLAFIGVQGTEKLEIATTSSEGTRTSRRSEVGCFRCGQKGHKAIGCAMPRRKMCFKCKKEGFTVRDCPNCANQGN